MKVDSLLLGHFVNSSDDRHPFYLYRLKDSTMLLFKLVDVCSFFNLPELPVSSLPPESYRDEQQAIYLSTPALSQVAIKHNKFLLAELCKLKPSDYAANLADSILSTMPSLECSKDYKKSSYNETDISISPLSPSHHPVKSEPLSPPLPSSATNNNTTSIRKSDPMALNSMLTHNTNGAGSQSRKQSRPIEDISNTTTTPKKQRLNEERNLLPKPAHTVSSQQAPPTLLAKRLSGKNARKLTIYAPSYNEQFQAGIRSAPLNSNFRQQQQQKKQPHPLSHQTVPKQKRKAEFAIPPIVPSQQQQQQPPHTAHHFPRSPLFHHPTSAFAHSFPITSGRIKEGGPPTSSSSSSSSSSTSSSTTASFNAVPALNNNNSSAATTATPLCQTPPSSLQRQQFMQPFEHLFDTIETTRSLKSTLDDQIRRSSTLIQTLQVSSTTIEGLIRNHVKEIQKESMGKMDDKLMELSKRITALETGKKLIVNPPTIVKSQNDINPKEYHTMLNTLLDRLDKLESQLES